MSTKQNHMPGKVSCKKVDRHELGRKSKRKGKKGERAVANMLRDRGYEARRGVQYRGDTDSPDVVSEIRDMHIEVKWVERLSVHVAMTQAKMDKNDNQFPTVWHKRRRDECLVTIPAEAFMDLLEKVYPPKILDILD